MKNPQKTPEQIATDTLEGMRGIGGMPTNEEFYAEFNFRLKVALGLLRHKDEKMDEELQIWNHAIDAVAYCVKEIINNKPKPPKLRTIVSYKAKYLRTKLKISKEYLFNIFNKKKKA